MFSNSRFSESVNHEALKVKPRLLPWDHHNMGCLSKKQQALGSSLKRKAICAANDKATGEGQNRTTEADVIAQLVLYAVHVMAGLNICPPGLQSCSTSILAILFLPSEKGMFILCHFILEICNFLFYFRGLTTKRLSYISGSRSSRLCFDSQLFLHVYVCE